MLISQRHAASGRWAVVDEVGTHSVWMYLTEPTKPRPVRDAFVFSRVEPISRDQVQGYAKSGGPPPVCVEFIGTGCIEDRARPPMALRWARDGESVCVMVDGIARAVASMHRERGMSRDLVKPGPWGEPWCEATFSSLFAAK